MGNGYDSDEVQEVVESIHGGGVLERQSDEHDELGSTYDYSKGNKGQASERKNCFHCVASVRP